ncbi:MAG: accessory gene regulator B family protein [Eubacteriales bacterium]|nr:accessory gene regulator B family protein [Eubacteriales bacterium]
MISNISDKITGSLVDAGAVTSEDKAIYEYGIRMGILMVINIATAVLIGLLLGMVWQCIVFLIAYNPVRTYAGGYHARTSLVCYLLSIPMMLAVLLGIKMMPWNGYICAIALLSALVTIGILAPVADPNKPLNEKEVSVYKKRARVYSAVLTGGAIVLWMAGMEQTSLSIVMALGVAAGMLVLGTARNRNHIKEKA